jgi:hypothetical protein
MSEEQQQTDPMAEYEAQMEEHEFLKREGLKAWVDLLVNLMGDEVPEERRPLLLEGLARFMGIGAPRRPQPAMYAPDSGPVSIDDVEFPQTIFEDSREDDSTVVYDWRSIAQGCTHAHRRASGHHEQDGRVVDLYRYAERLMTLEGPAAESFWKWQEQTRGPGGLSGVRIIGPMPQPPVRVRRLHRRNPKRRTAES